MSIPLLLPSLLLLLLLELGRPLRLCGDGRRGRAKCRII